MVVKAKKPTSPGAQRILFHNTKGGIDLSRLVEQLIPTVVVGMLVIYANSKVTEYQMADLRKDMDRATATQAFESSQRFAQSEKLASITAQITSFLAQQSQLNAAMDARLTYIERGQRR